QTKMKLDHFLRFLVFLWVSLIISASPTCKLKGKFNLNGFQEATGSHLVLGGMFPIHFRIISSNASSTTVPESEECEGFNFRTFRWVRAMMFAINEINNRKDILPNINLGYTIYDSCFTISKAVEGTLTYLTGQDEAVPNYRCSAGAPLAALIGAGGSALSIATARILGLYYFPQVAYSSSCSVLSDKFQFPSFLRTIPNDNFQSRAMARLIVSFGWTWVGTIAADDDYGKYGIKLFKEEVEKVGVCISFSETLPKVYSMEKILKVVHTIKASTANIIVVFSSETDFNPLIEEIVNHNMTGKTWIASEAWSTSALISRPEYSSTLGGTIGFAIRRAEIKGFKDFLHTINPRTSSDKLVHEFWQRAFNCTLPNSLLTINKTSSNNNSTQSRIHNIPPFSENLCTGNEKLDDIGNTYSDVTQLRLTYSVYKAVYTAAYALHNLQACEEGSGPFVNGTCANILDFEPWQLMYYLKHVNFSTHGEVVRFDSSGDVNATYDIINWLRNPDGSVSYVNIGHYDSTVPLEHQMTVDNGSIFWNNDETEVPRSVCSESCLPGTRKGIRQGEPVCCFDCILCADGEITNETDSRECIQCPEDYWSNANKDECVKKLVEYLAFEEALGITLIALSVFGACIALSIVVVFIIYRDTALVKANDRELSFLIQLALAIIILSSIVFIGKPARWSCMTRQVLLALAFALCLSCVMGKAVLLMLTAKAAKAKSSENTDKELLKPLYQKLIAFTGTIIQGIICTIYLVLIPPYPIKNTASQNIKIILECNEGSVIFLCCVFGYDVLLALLCFIFAFIGRKLPDNFNEAKFMTFAMLVFFIVWISFVPAYLSTRGKFMVAVEIFAILASSFGLLGCLFVPKCYIIILKPERNTEELVRGKPTGNDKSAPPSSVSLTSEANSTTISTVPVDE
uniref:Vomeronasal 2, receptor 1 n=1 Tax=Latimeria chalumnae TaxID=7897 RepID=H3AJ13_LATCH